MQGTKTQSQHRAAEQQLPVQFWHVLALTVAAAACAVRLSPVFAQETKRQLSSAGRAPPEASGGHRPQCKAGRAHQSFCAAFRMLKLASSASMSSTRICGPVRSTSRSLERVMWSLCASARAKGAVRARKRWESLQAAQEACAPFTIPSHVAAMPWQYWKSGSTSNGSSTCTPMSSVPSLRDRGAASCTVRQGRPGRGSHGPCHERRRQRRRSADDWPEHKRHRVAPDAIAIVRSAASPGTSRARTWACVARTRPSGSANSAA